MHLSASASNKATQQKNRKSPSHQHHGWGDLFLELKSGLAFDDFAGLDAAGADAHALACAIDLSLYGLQIDVPATPGGVVGVRNIVAELRTFAAKITFLCHDEILQSRIAETSRKSGLSSKNLKRSVEVVGTSGFEPLTSTVSR